MFQRAFQLPSHGSASPQPPAGHFRHDGKFKTSDEYLASPAGAFRTSLKAPAGEANEYHAEIRRAQISLESLLV